MEVDYFHVTMLADSVIHYVMRNVLMRCCVPSYFIDRDNTLHRTHFEIGRCVLIIADDILSNFDSLFDLEQHLVDVVREHQHLFTDPVRREILLS